VEEANRFPDLREFLQAVNSGISVVESAKCDAWATEDLSPEEDIFGASCKLVSYVDLVFSGDRNRQSLASHERFSKRLVELLRQTPETASSMELCVRRAYYDAARETIQVSISQSMSAVMVTTRPQPTGWEIALQLTANSTSTVGGETGVSVGMESVPAVVLVYSGLIAGFVGLVSSLKPLTWIRFTPGHKQLA
jgi:hypothetical protein